MSIINCRAAVAWEPNTPLAIEQIEVAPPKAGEMRIKILYTTLCHTDLTFISGQFPESQFPAILGHEASGVVESVGEGVTSVMPGDHVIPCLAARCRECVYCRNPKTNLCEKLPLGKAKCQGTMPDGTSRFTCRGQTIYHFFGVSSFSEYTVCAEYAVSKIDQKAPLDKVCLLGCGISTGYGAAINTSKVEPGSRVAVWGLGAVGLAAVMGAKVAGAKQIVGIDTVSGKMEKAQQFGITDFVNPKTDVPEGKSLQEYLIEKFDGGFDYTFECVGNVNTMRQAYESTHKGWGVSCVVGLAQEFGIHPLNLILGRMVKGTMLGGWKGRDDIPGLVLDYLSGKIKLDEFITHKYPFPEINKAIDHMKAGESIRTLITLTDQ